jgi:hypothetical protein
VSGYRRRGVAYRPPEPEQNVERHVRSRWSLPSFATVVILAFLAVPVLSAVSAFAPTGGAQAASDDRDEPSQGYAHAEPAHPTIARDGYSVSRIHTAPAVGLPDPGSAQAIAYDMLLARGWDQQEYECLVALWTRESNWNVYAHNPSSGAYGIPQSLPGEKMASAGADWKTNPATQITWGLGYIAARYGTPCGAWEHSERKGWY